MSILIIGANGGVGSKLVDQLTEEGKTFTAGVRKEDQKAALEEKGIKSLLIDVEKDDIDTLKDKVKGFEKVIFSVGSGGSTGADKTITVDLDGAIKTIEASKIAGIQRYIMVSTYDSRREAFEASGDLKPYTIVKHYADEYLKNSGLTYSIIHPGVLLDEPGTGKIDVGAFFEGRGSIPREDVASVLKEVAQEDGEDNQEFQIVQGETDIKEAIAQI
ncbi:SDR family oxidoreductase [Staphylococcus sp. SQ8-PEA]|uniref:SDR family oxidoreductase n=1 Tax=Staphylococcus marylandisciuri TaxID=2981529 RepID=A0ABT2QRK4_9STAP|nr:SDR family oxidoreductase [Staphylococcus marylandisciuri]MCU5746609.1 SDR family oxidoreductase [Staphylococcus marylandisciuri]